MWNDVVWALPVTTCLPEHWAARNISFSPAFSIPSIWFSFINLSKRANDFASSSYLRSPLLAQGPPMSSDRNPHILRIIAPFLLPPQSSRVQWAGCVAWSCVCAVVSISRALGGSFQDPHLLSSIGQTGSISSPGFSFTWPNNTIYVKATVSLAHLFPFSFQLQTQDDTVGSVFLLSNEFTKSIFFFLTVTQP